jgi:uncharacterized protein with PIN domain
MQTYNNRRYSKEQIETTLIRLNSLKVKVTELRIKCEKLKSLQTEKLEKRCKECNKKIIRGKEVTFKDSSGKITQYYHKHCFETLVAYLK